MGLRVEGLGIKASGLGLMFGAWGLSLLRGTLVARIEVLVASAAVSTVGWFQVTAFATADGQNPA